MTFYYTEPTVGDRDRLYARIETETDRERGTLARLQFGTIGTDSLTAAPVQESERVPGEILLDELDDHYEAQIRRDFEERPLEGFVEEIVDRTPFPRPQAEVVVACSLFDLPEREALRAINQYSRETYEELTREEFEERREAARETHVEIHNATTYPIDI